MTTLRTAAQQALEAIYEAKLCEFNSMSSRSEMIRLMNAAITILEAALAEPVHETIARLQKARAQFDEERRQALEQGKCWSCMQPLPEELKTEYQVNHDLPMGCDHCNHPLWCGTKCSNCGKVWEWASGIEE